MLARLLLRGSVAVVVAAALTGAEGLDSGELHCEEAAKHLADCCHVVFDYQCTAGRGCDEGRPQLDDPQASRVRDTSCETLIAQGACENPPLSPSHPDLSVTDLAHSDLSHPDLSLPDLSLPPDLASSDAGDL